MTETVAGRESETAVEAASRLQDEHTRTMWTPFQQMQTIRERGPLIFERAEGVFVYDIDGREYLDGHASLWLANAGYGRSEIIDAAHEQMKKMAYFSTFMGFSNRPAIELATRLTALAAPEGMGKVFYSTSGSEAVETALKMARQYWYNRGKAGKHKFIARRSAYHGVTFGAMSATGMAANRRAFGPLVPGFRHVPAPNCYRNDFGIGLSEEEVSEAASEALRQAIEFEHPDTVAAFIVEPVQGAAGVIIPPESYLAKCREICTEHDVLLIADEVITGFGRVGSWFGSRRYGVTPDIMCFAKGLTGGYVPLGATACRDEIYESFLGVPGDGTELRHGNTYAGHATGAAAALANLAILERDDLPGNARIVGEHLLDGLERLTSHEVVGDVRGVGLLARVELVADRATRRPFAQPGRFGTAVQERALELGLIVRNVGDVITLSPPLTITAAHADRIVETLDAAVAHACATLL